MPEDLQQLGADLISLAGRVVRWAPNEGFDMSLAAARVMARLLDSGPMRISDLAAREHCSQPTISNHVQRLERAGLVGRSGHSTDGRVSVIRITKAGEAELKNMRQIIGQNLTPALGALSDADREALRAGLEVMRRLMSQSATAENQDVKESDEDR
jgi:DNA-binding MarR family transcriptional regulator